MNIYKEQEKIIQFIKTEINKLKDKQINISKSSLSYFTIFGETLGYAKIMRLRNRIFGTYNFYKIFLKELLNIVKNYELEFISSLKRNDVENLIISNASITDFYEDGSYMDRYFKINSNDFSEITYMLNYSSDKIPLKISKNIILFKNKKNNFFPGVFFLIKKIVEDFFKKNFFYEISSQSILSENLFKFLKNNFNIKNLKKIVVPYEGQPFQQFIFSEIKKINKDILNIGYDHSAPHSMPLNLFHREGAPDILIVNSPSQKENSVNFLNWPIEKIRIAPSLRYSAKSSEDFSYKIFFPYKIFDEKIVLNQLDFFLNCQKNFSLNRFDIKIHPVSPYQKTQIKLKEKIKSIFANHKDKFSDNNLIQEMSIFIGATTAVIVALEKNVKVIHICEDPVLDSYSNYMWPKLIINQLTSNIFEYSLKDKKTFLIFGEEKNLFKNYYFN